MRKYRSTTLLFLLFLVGFQVSAQVTADFVADTTKGCGSAAVQFTDLSSGNITSWSWSFGNSNTSTLQNPSAAYTVVGNYDVTLTVSDGTNSDSKTITDYVSVFSLPKADFTLNPTTGCSPLPVSFTNTSTQGSGAITTYLWDFSDGSQPSSAQNPTHIYQTGGTYPPSLQVIDQNGCSDIIVFNDVIVTAAPIANFSTLNPPQTCADTLTVNFIDNSTGSSLSYKWDFGDGQTSTQASPTHFYNGLGTYDVTLIVSDPNCSDTLFLEDFVKLERTNAQFSFPTDSVCYGAPVNFKNESTGANLFRWDFGDGTTSAQENPTKTFQDSGLFIVKLTVSAGPICLNTYIDTIYVQKVIADFISSPNFICDDLDTITFNDQSFNADSISWRITKPLGLKSDQIDTTSSTSLDYILNNKLGDKISGFIRVDGIYSDTLIAISKLGCRDTIIKDSNRIVQLLRTEILFNDDTLKKPWTMTPGFVEMIGGCDSLSFDFRDSTLGSTPIVKWEWDLGIDTSSLEFPPSQLYFDDTLNVVSLTVTNNLGCIDTDTLYIQPGTKQSPSYVISIDSVCPGDTLQIRNTSQDSLKINGGGFQFYSNNGNDQISILLDGLVDSYPDTGYYQIIQTIIHNGCDTVNIKDSGFFVNGPIASPSYSAGDCQNRRLIQFDGDFRGVTNFIWDFGDGSPKDSINSNPLHLYPSDSTYRATLTIRNDTNGCGSRDLDTILIDITPLPLLRILPANKNLCANDTIILRSNASMRYEKFTWLIDGDTVSRKSRYQIIDTLPGTYIVELFTEDIFGCNFLAIDTMVVSQLSAAFDTSILKGCTPVEIEFKDVSFSDTLITNWFWTFGSNDTSYQSIDTITYSTSNNNDLFFRVENIFGCKDSIFIKDYLSFDNLNVRFLNGLTQICAGDSITFRNVSSGLNVIYTWNFGDGNSLISTDEFVGHRYINSGQYTVSLNGEDASGCNKIDSKPNLVKVDPIPIPAFTADTLEADCYPFAVNFQDTSQGNVTQWEWKFGDATSSIFKNPFHNYTSVGNFDIFLKVTSPNGCVDSLEKVAYIKTKGPEAEFSFSKDTICLNEEVTFSITQSSNVASFFWDFGDGNGGQGNPINHIYTQKTGMITVALIVSDTSGNCIVPLEDSLFVYEVLADFLISDDSVCVPYEAQFTKQSIGDDSFRWNFGSGNFSTEENPTFNYSQAGKYQASLEISSTIGCRDTAFNEIEVFPIPFALVNADTGICVGNSILLVGSGGISYQWSPTSSLSSPFNDSTIATPDSTTIYQLIIANEADCRDTIEVEVFVQQDIIYNRIPDSTIIIGETINLSAYAGLGFNYRWTPGIGLSCNNCDNPIAQPLANQRYILEIFDDYGCFYLKDTIEIEVIEKYSLDVPTAFSPNGDGSNDIIYAKGWGLKELIGFKIYNRFGELVFESTSFDVGWDGTYRGQDQNIETYIFTVEALTYSGKVLTKKGNISLLR